MPQMLHPRRRLAGVGVWQLLVMRWQCRRLGCTTSVVGESKGEYGMDSLEQIEIKTQIPQKNPGGLSLVITSSVGSWYYINEKQRLAGFLPFWAPGWAESRPQTATCRPQALETGTGRRMGERKIGVEQRWRWGGRTITKNKIKVRVKKLL